MKSLIFVLIMASGSLFSLDRFLDINLTTDFTNLKERSHVDFNSQAVVPFKSRALLLSPRISLFFDGSMDVSVATGLRHQTPFGVVGHHVFWDSTGTKDAHFHQIGHSLDLLTKNFDYRINYYHPVTKQQTYKNFLVSPHRWVESEIVYKHRLFHIGAGPKYDIFDKLWGAQAKITFPFNYFSVGSIASYDNRNGFSGSISLSFRLYGTTRKNSLESPIYHQSRVQYSKEYIFQPPPPEKKRQSEEEESKKDAASQNDPKEVTTTPIIDPVAPEPSDETPPPPPPKSWWNFFFGKETTPNRTV